MPSISEQLQKYHALNGGAAQKNAPGAACAVQWQHPNTKDYFRNLMKQWRENNRAGLPVAGSR